MLFIVRLTQQCDVKLSCKQSSYMFQPLGVILRHEDDPKGLKHVATLIVYSLTLHHIVV